MAKVTAAGAPSFITILTGPTASGKTAVSLDLAEALDAEIINADSRQVYRGFDIGTAKPTPDERARVRHHGIDVCGADETWTAGRFFHEARRWMCDIADRGKRILVVGGSGMYVRALVEGIFDSPDIDATIRNELRRRYRREGLPPLLRELRELDPETAIEIDAANPVRVLRALEVCLQSGRPYSRLRRERMPDIPYRSLMLGIAWERHTLYNRIEERVDAMIDAGFENEVRGLLAEGVPPECSAMRAVGYKEFVMYVTLIADFEDTVATIKQRTRNLAKRQMTWFRREAAMKWLSGAMAHADIVNEAAKRVNEAERETEQTMKER
jgi:tRNA dimethylallyltransferase